MCFPIDKETFDLMRGGRLPIVEIRDSCKFAWRYWMTKDGEVFAWIMDRVIKFGPYRVETEVDSSEWVMEPGEVSEDPIIQNHLHRGRELGFAKNKTFESGYYRLECPKIKKSYEVYISVEDSGYGGYEIYIWWPGKSKILTSLPLIYETISFYNAVLWKKY